ncbi:MAG: hypothetical protein U1D55_19120 [Phycisphaerae bacterium]
MRTKKSQQFRLEVFLLVMLRLTGDVLLDGLFLRLAAGERAVTLLPCERREDLETSDAPRVMIATSPS